MTECEYNILRSLQEYIKDSSDTYMASFGPNTIPVELSCPKTIEGYYKWLEKKSMSVYEASPPPETDVEL